MIAEERIRHLWIMPDHWHPAERLIRSACVLLLVLIVVNCWTGSIRTNTRLPPRCRLRQQRLARIGDAGDEIRCPPIFFEICTPRSHVPHLSWRRGEPQFAGTSSISISYQVRLGQRMTLRAPTLISSLQSTNKAIETEVA